VCSGDLGQNSDVEHFPIGRTLAFDSHRGRLWVVCERCRRWNLSPLEERWEAVESLERLWEKSAMQIRGESLSLARLRSGLRLIRVGKAPSEVEMAVWRWGRRAVEKSRVIPALAVVGTAGLGTAMLAVPPAAGALGLVVVGYAALSHALDGGFGLATAMDEAGDVRSLRRREVLRAAMTSSDDELGWSIHIKRRLRPSTTRPFLYIPGMPNITEEHPPESHWVEFTGDRAVAVARRTLPLANGAHAKAGVIADALGLIQHNGGSDRYVRETAATKAKWARLRDYPRAQRLALEVALFQDEERRALDGELRGLELAWKEAEEIAAISDSLFLPKGWELFRKSYVRSS
ncbi:MAG: hypothetical protein OEZ37_13585, partial [Gemmatimonadota bacterium]|nr:hypothetical protein [Gemmatimonadota bacterium]